mmetsp:Transcript_30442/g.53481  ORF Transcript_30442/g.53481 Transcript_30442/m.53481 type:complete len:101 (-) Transcript_30442:26-328(-)
MEPAVARRLNITSHLLDFPPSIQRRNPNEQTGQESSRLLAQCRGSQKKKMNFLMHIIAHHVVGSGSHVVHCNRAKRGDKNQARAKMDSALCVVQQAVLQS